MKKTIEITGRQAAIDAFWFDDDEQTMEAFEALMEQAYTETCEAASTYGCIQITAADGRTWYLHRSARYAGHLQLTLWDERGPVSDYEIIEPLDLDERIADQYEISA